MNNEPQQVPTWLMPAFIVWTLITVFWSSINSWLLYHRGRGDNNFDAIKKELHESNLKHQRELHEANTKLLDERERRISHQLNNHAQQVVNAMDTIAEHARQSDERYQELAQGGPRLQLELARALGEAREFVRINAADKNEFKEFCDESRRGREEMLRAISSLERQVVTTEDLRKILEEMRRGQ